MERTQKIRSKSNALVRVMSAGQGPRGPWRFLAFAFCATLLPFMASAERPSREIKASFRVAQADGTAANRNSLQSLIDLAPEGATIEVSSGVHRGSLSLTKSVTLKGAADGTSMIEHAGPGPAIMIEGAQNVIIENVAIRWAFDNSVASKENPAAVVVNNSTAELRGCRIEPIEFSRDTPGALLVKGRSQVKFVEGKTEGFAYAILFTEGARGEVRDSILTHAGHSVITLHRGTRVVIQGNVLADCGYHAVRNTGGTMEMSDNLVLDNNRAGAYLGNRSAHGTIRNNLFMGNRGAIWAYARSDMNIENNIFARSKDSAVSFRNTCELTLRGNSFLNNPIGLIQYEEKKVKGGYGAALFGNHYSNNEKDQENYILESSLISGKPNFTNPAKGDFSPGEGSPLLDDLGQVRAGLSDAAAIEKVWARWQEHKSGGKAGA